MKTVLVIVGASAASIWFLVKAVIGPMLQEEAATRLSRIPVALISLAAAQLPPELCDDVAAEWRAELCFVLHDTQGMPVTRLLRGIRYSAGLVMSAPAIADSLRGRAGRVLRIARYLALISAAGFAVWEVIYACGLFRRASQLPIRYAYSPLENPPANAHELVLTGIGTLCAAAAFLGFAILLATAKWGITHVNNACFAAGGVLVYLGGGSLYSIVVAVLVFCIAVSTVELQLRMRRRRRAATRGVELITAPKFPAGH